MRYLPLGIVPVLLPALLLAGCASTAPARPATDARADARAEAMADSLLALPPDSLSSADWEWLRLHEQRRAREETGRRIGAAETAAVLGAVLLGGVVTFWLAVQGGD